MIALNSILVPTDFSETSLVAVTYGSALARAFGARLTLMHVVPDGFGEEIIAAATLGMFQIAERSAGVRLQTLLTPQDRRELRAEYVVTTGHPEEEIVGHARTHGTDLIILATRGRSAMAHILEGSVTEKLLRTAPCPVLIVRHPEHEFVMPEAAAS
jgi:nucleotide-binding universal stress UspA family protein